MKCQILFSVKIKKNVTNLSSGELAQRVVKVKITAFYESMSVMKTVGDWLMFPDIAVGGAFVYCGHTVKFQWLEHRWNHGNLFEILVVRVTEG